MAKLLDPFFHLGGGAVLHFKHERRGAAQIERHQGLQEVIAVEFALVIRARRLVDHANPQLIRDMETLSVAVHEAIEFC